MQTPPQLTPRRQINLLHRPMETKQQGLPRQPNLLNLPNKKPPHKKVVKKVAWKAKMQTPPQLTPCRQINLLHCPMETKQQGPPH
jgi:hypothetical protein